MSDTKETTDVRNHRGIEVRLRPVYADKWMATWRFPTEPGTRFGAPADKETALRNACEQIDNYYINSAPDMPYIEIENTVTDALLRIPGQMTYVRQQFEDMQMDDYSDFDVDWEHWTRPWEGTLKEMKENPPEDHFVYSHYESLAQSDEWARAIKYLRKEDTGFRASTSSAEDVIIRTGRV